MNLINTIINNSAFKQIEKRIVNSNDDAIDIKDDIRAALLAKNSKEIVIMLGQFRDEHSEYDKALYDKLIQEMLEGE